MSAVWGVTGRRTGISDITSQESGDRGGGKAICPPELQNPVSQADVEWVLFNSIESRLKDDFKLTRI